MEVVKQWGPSSFHTDMNSKKKKTVKIFKILQQSCDFLMQICFCRSNNGNIPAMHLDKRRATF